VHLFHGVKCGKEVCGMREELTVFALCISMIANSKLR
jgi:hypothetical protein